jgi:hypothetical protein
MSEPNRCLVARHLRRGTLMLCKQHYMLRSYEHIFSGELACIAAIHHTTRISGTSDTVAAGAPVKLFQPLLERGTVSARLPCSI